MDVWCFVAASPVSDRELHQRLCSESMLLIRREDVLQRLTPDCSLSSLSEQRWKALDVEGESVDLLLICRVFIRCAHMCSVCFCLFFVLVGQVRQMHREEEEEDDGAKLTHIRIPAAYSSGVTFFALRESELGQELLSAPELPLLWRDWHSRTRLIYGNILKMPVWATDE